MNETPKPPSRIRATWAGGRRWDAGKPGGAQTRIDGETALSPPETLLSALAACSGVDLVDILAKRRTPAESVVVDIEGHRRAESPRRYEHLVMTYRVNGAGIERVHAERAVHLAFEKYCSVAASLAPDIVIETSVVLNGEEGSRVRQPMYVPA